MKPDLSQIVPYLAALIVVYLVYRRFRRNFGQQPLRPVRMRVRIAVLLLVGAMLAPGALRSNTFLLGSLAGIAVGIVLAMVGASRTRFVRDARQLYYLPHTYTGVAVSLLFLGRLAYRLMQVYSNMHGNHESGLDAADQAFTPVGMVRSPLTVGLFYVLMSYYVCYYSMVLWKSTRVAVESASAPAVIAGGSRDLGI